MTNVSVYEDQFERTDNTNISTSAPMGGSYTEVTSDFQIVSGKLKSIGLTAHLAIVSSPTFNTADYTIQAGVFTANGFGSGIGLVFRYVDSNNYYYARINTVAQNLILYKKVAGVNTQLGSTSTNGEATGNTYTLKVNIAGNNITVYENGTSKITATDSTFPSAGTVGFWTDYGNSTFDNFYIAGDINKGTISSIGNDYSQPALPIKIRGFNFNSVDQQVVTKSDGWNQGQSERIAEFNEIKNITGATHVAIAVPYSNLTKYTNYVTDARTVGLKVFHRSHWNSWEGDNSYPVGLTKEDYLDDTYRFITQNPTLFAAGDLFGMCVEPNNADNSGNTTFKTTGVFDITKYNQFCKDQVRYANQAFTDIGLGGTIYTFPISPSVSLLNLGGQNWTNTSGDNNGLGNSDFVTYFGGYVSIDHYEADAIRNADTYYTAYNNDLDKFRAGFPDCKLFIGEFGYHTTTSVTDAEQYSVFDRIVTACLSKPFIIGLNFWVQMGSTTASIWNDSSGSIVAGGRQAVTAVKRCFGTPKKKRRNEVVISD